MADTTLSKILITIRKRWWMLAVAALLGLAYGLSHIMSQPKPMQLIIRVGLSLLDGIAVAFLVKSFDTGLRSIAEIEDATGFPSFGTIPRSRSSTTEKVAKLTAAQRNIGVLTEPGSQFAEAVRSLQSSLLLSSAGHPPKFVLFTSASPAEGKTTVATNLACALARGGSRVLLIDADLWRPDIHRRLGLNGQVGLTTLLIGTSRLEEAVQSLTEIPNLDILPSGPTPPFPTEMLGSELMKQLLAQFGEMYTHVVVDGPPILSVADGVVLARDADVVVLIVRHGKSSKRKLRAARDLLLLSGAKVTGIVLNECGTSSARIG